MPPPPNLKNGFAPPPLPENNYDLHDLHGDIYHKIFINFIEMRNPHEISICNIDLTLSSFVLKIQLTYDVIVCRTWRPRPARNTRPTPLGTAAQRNACRRSIPCLTSLLAQSTVLGSWRNQPASSTLTGQLYHYPQGRLRWACSRAWISNWMKISGAA